VLLKVHLTSIDCSAVSPVRVAAMDEIPSAVIAFLENLKEPKNPVSESSRPIFPAFSPTFHRQLE
jgi:hypothetical protein